jgi:hypothetical protein
MSASYCTLRRNVASETPPACCRTRYADRPSANRRAASSGRSSNGISSTSSPAAISDRSSGTTIDPYSGVRRSNWGGRRA